MTNLPESLARVRRMTTAGTHFGLLPEEITAIAAVVAHLDALTAALRSVVDLVPAWGIGHSAELEAARALLAPEGPVQP